MRKKVIIWMIALVLVFIALCLAFLYKPSKDAVSVTVVCPTQKVIKDNVKIGDMWKKGRKLTASEQGFLDTTYENDFCITLSNNTIKGDKAVFGEAGFKSMEEFEASKYSNIVKTNYGKIEGIDNGEWGGKVKFSPYVGLGYTLVGENFRGFYMVNGRLFVLTGLVHGMGDKGSLYELYFDNGSWKAKLIYNFKSSPNTYLVVENNVYVITNKALYLMENGTTVKTILKKAFWDGLYPNSMILANSKLYVGMRGGMFSVGLDDKAITWYPIVDRLKSPSDF